MIHNENALYLLLIFVMTLSSNLFSGVCKEYPDSADWVSGIVELLLKTYGFLRIRIFVVSAKLRDYADRIQQLETLAS